MATLKQVRVRPGSLPSSGCRFQRGRSQGRTGRARLNPPSGATVLSKQRPPLDRDMFADISLHIGLLENGTLGRSDF